MLRTLLNLARIIPRGHRRVIPFVLMAIGLGVATSPAMVFAADGRALSDVATIQVAGDIGCPKTGIPRSSSPAAADSVEKATAGLEKALRTDAKPSSLRALTESPDVRDPAAASNLAVVALSNYLGNYQGAFTMASAAEKLPGADDDNVRSSLLVNKGNALLGLGRPQEAQAALYAAIKLAPDLRQAYTTMAYALGDQGKCSRAVRFLRAGAFRHPPKAVVDAAMNDKADIDPDNPSPADQIERLPAMASVDMSRGRSGSLPRVTYGTNYEAVAHALDGWEERNKGSLMQMMKAGFKMQKSGDAVIASLAALRKSGSLSAELTARRVEFLMSLLRAELDSDTMEHQKMRTAFVKMDEEAHRINREAGDAHLDALKIKRVNIDPERCAIMTTALGREATVRRQFDHVARDSYGVLYHRATAIAANFSDPVYHQHASDLIDLWRYQYILLLNPVTPVGGSVFYEACTPAKIKLPPAEPDALSGLPSTCQDVGNKTKLTAKAGAVSVGVSCEKVEAKVSTPGPLDIFIKAAYEGYNPTKKLTDPKERFVERTRGGDPDKAINMRQWGAAFDGTLTIYGGVEGTATTGGLATTASAGVSVTIDGSGNISDAGGKTGISTSLVGGVGAGGFGVGFKTELGSGPIEMPSFVSAPDGLDVYSD